MRAAAVMATVLALGAAAVLRYRRGLRERSARTWADATDTVDTPPAGVGA